MVSVAVGKKKTEGAINAYYYCFYIVRVPTVQIDGMSFVFRFVKKIKKNTNTNANGVSFRNTIRVLRIAYIVRARDGGSLNPFRFHLD